jgi:hypothetical protein
VSCSILLGVFGDFVGLTRSARPAATERSVGYPDAFAMAVQALAKLRVFTKYSNMRIFLGQAGGACRRRFAGDAKVHSGPGGERDGGDTVQAARSAMLFVTKK